VQTLKILALGTLFSFFVFIGWLRFLNRHMPQGEATGLQAIKAMTWYSPFFWLTVLLIVLAYGVAFWFVKR
jgi:hypothetical protein